MPHYLQNVKKLFENFEGLDVLDILRSKNIWADALSHLVTSSFSELNQKVLIEQLNKPSIEILFIFQVGHEPNWIDLLMD